MHKKIALDHIQNNSLTGIKAGVDRPGFLDIWMVVVEDRIFARSWGFAERSWYNTFLQNPHGQIKCGNNIIAIKAVVPADIASVTEKINLAYLTKYNTGANSKYAQGIVGEDHIAKTMEFVIMEVE